MSVILSPKHPDPSRALALFIQAQGSVDSLADLLEYYRPMLEKLSHKRVGRKLAGKVSASEVTQVAIISASQRFAEFRGETVEQFRAWLCTILENAITDHSRRFLAARCRSAQRETQLPSDLAEDTSVRPSEICSTHEQVLKLLQVVENLPADLRIIVRMRYQQDLTFIDIADRLGISVATVRRRWLQAVDQIEQAMH
jgi:RNA polymerase sigma-70 factor, ECF subfamily